MGRSSLTYPAYGLPRLYEARNHLGGVAARRAASPWLPALTAGGGRDPGRPARYSVIASEARQSSGWRSATGGKPATPVYPEFQT